MKNKLLILFVFSVFVTGIQAQNLQLHYDFRKEANSEGAAGRGYLTSTLEMFKPDKHGSTFWFVDFDYDADKGAISLAYFELARDQKIGEFPMLLHLEYNGGLFHKGDVGGNIGNSYLLGVNRSFKIGELSLGTTLAYKYIEEQGKKSNIQLTATWFRVFADGKFTVSGFIDLWTANDYDSAGKEDGKKLIIITEPQFWYNFNKNISVGTEIEISNNFVFGSDKWEIFPTLGCKWSF